MGHWHKETGMSVSWPWMVVGLVVGLMVVAHGCSGDSTRIRSSPQAGATTAPQGPLPVWLKGAIRKDQREHPDRVTEVYIKNDAVEDKDLVDLRRLPSLETVILKGRKLTENSLAYVRQVRGLKTLRILFPLTATGWRYLESMESLKTLDIGGIRLSEGDVDALIRLRGIESLAFSADWAPEGTLARLRAMGSLRELKVLHAPEQEGALRSLRGLSQVHRLHVYLYYTAEDRHLACLEGLGNLVTLDLHNTRITDKGLMSLGSLMGLTTLNLNDTAITDGGMEALAGWVKLQELYLERTRITGKGMKSLSNMRELVRLRLDSTQIDNDGLRYLQDLKRLRVLSLRKCPRISDEGMLWLTGLESLRGLEITSRIQAGEEAHEGPKFVRVLNPTRVKETLRGLKNLEIADFDEQALFDMFP